MSENKQKPIVPVPPVAPAAATHSIPRKRPVSDSTRVVRAVCAWVVIISAALFAFVSILGIWNVFGTSTEDVIGKSLSSLFVIGFAAGVIAIVASLLDDNK